MNFHIFATLSLLALCVSSYSVAQEMEETTSETGNQESEISPATITMGTSSSATNKDSDATSAAHPSTTEELPSNDATIAPTRTSVSSTTPPPIEHHSTTTTEKPQDTEMGHETPQVQNVTPTMTTVMPTTFTTEKQNGTTPKDNSSYVHRCSFLVLFISSGLLPVFMMRYQSF